jgi:hypothetical protein
MTSQRVLNGSKTKGSTASLSGSIQYFHQGTSVRTFTSYVGSIIPRLGSGDRLEVYKDGIPFCDTKRFDDSIIINNTLTDIGGPGDGRRVEERVNHFYENRNFGQPPTTLMGEVYADTIRFNPVSYINDPGEVMWPVNMWNAGSLDKHEFDGVIEPLDIRKEVLGYLDTRYEGRAIRGALVGAASERPWGSKEITDTWFLYDNPESAFLDAPVTHRKIDKQQPSPVTYSEFKFSRYVNDFWLHDFIDNPSERNEYTSKDNIELWAVAGSGVMEDESGNSVAIALEQPEMTITDPMTFGSVSYPAITSYGYSGNNITFGPNSTYWDSVFKQSTVAGLSSYTGTLSIWINTTGETGYSTLFGFSTANAGGDGGIRVYLDDTTYGNSYTGNTASGSRLRVQIGGSINTFSDCNNWVTSESGHLEDGEWHNVVVTFAIVSDDNEVFPSVMSAAGVSVYIDGEQIEMVQCEMGFNSRSSSFNLVATSGNGSYHAMEAGYNAYTFEEKIALPAIWSSQLSASEVKALYKATIAGRGSIYNLTRTVTDVEYGDPLNDLAIQGYQDIGQSSDTAFLESGDYHDRVYFSLLTHNNSDMRLALRKLNKVSCESLTDPLEKRASRGLTTGQTAGSIAFSDTFVVGDKNEG